MEGTNKLLYRNSACLEQSLLFFPPSWIINVVLILRLQSAAELLLALVGRFCDSCVRENNFLYKVCIIN